MKRIATSTDAGAERLRDDRLRHRRAAPSGSAGSRAAPRGWGTASNSPPWTWARLSNVFREKTKSLNWPTSVVPLHHSRDRDQQGSEQDHQQETDVAPPRQDPLQARGSRRPGRPPARCRRRRRLWPWRRTTAPRAPKTKAETIDATRTVLSRDADRCRAPCLSRSMPRVPAFDGRGRCETTP